MNTTMKAVVYRGANRVEVEDRPVPTLIEPTDAIVRLTRTTICGTDLGIWKGKNPEIETSAAARNGSFDGRILGHEGVGVIEQVGSAVKGFLCEPHALRGAADITHLGGWRAYLALATPPPPAAT